MCHKFMLVCFINFFVTYGIAVQLDISEVESAEKILGESLNEPLSELEVLHTELNNTSYPLFYAGKWDNFKDAAMAYLEKGNTPNVYFKPPFYECVTLLEIATRFVSEFGDWSLLKKMREKKADFNFMSPDPKQQDSILIKAKLDTGNKYAHKLIKFLLKHGADPTLQGASKISPIHFFAQFTNYDAESLELLVASLKQKGIDTNVKVQEKGDTPLLTMAKYSGSLMNWELVLEKLTILLNYGANLEEKNNKGKNALTLIEESQVYFPGMKNVKEQMKGWLRGNGINDTLPE